MQQPQIIGQKTHIRPKIVQKAKTHGLRRVFLSCQVFSSEQFIQGNAEQLCHGKQQCQIGICSPPLPFGNCLHADVQMIRQLTLCHATAPPKSSDHGPNWNTQTMSSCVDDSMIHRRTQVLCMAELRRPQAAQPHYHSHSRSERSTGE